ncbi:helix-turn-helix domain-containing protein [Pseudomonas sp. TMB3-21]
MSMELMVKAMKTKVGNPLRKLVLIKLADNANDQGECWPSYQHIADQCEIDRSTVRRHIKQLHAQKLLRIENRDGPKGNSSNLYYLTLRGVGPERIPVGPESTGGVGPESTRTSNPSEPVNEPKPMGSPEPLEGFEAFWKMYPKKKSRKEALKAWAKLKPDDDLRQTLITALGKHCISVDWKKEGGRYIPNASTWLNGERWTDVLRPASAGNSSSYTDLPVHTAEMYQGGENGPAF